MKYDNTDSAHLFPLTIACSFICLLVGAPIQYAIYTAVAIFVTNLLTK